MNNTRKYVKRDYTCMDAIDVYNLVRTGELKKFPNNYLDKETIRKIVRHVFINEMHLTKEEIVSTLDHDFMSNLSMGGFRKLFGNKDYNVILYSFPEMHIKAWEFKKVEPNFWKDKQNQRDFLLWVMEKENINPHSKEDLRKLTARTIINYGGSRILKEEPDFYSFLTTVIGDEFKEWEIMKVGVWKKGKIVEAVKWLVEEKMQYSLEQASNLKISDFKKYNLDGMLQKGCNHSILYALNLTYGDCFMRDGIRGIKYTKAIN